MHGGRAEAMIILLEYVYVNIWIALMTVLLWINDGEFSMLDHSIIFLFAIAGMVHIRTKIKSTAANDSIQ